MHRRVWKLEPIIKGFHTYLLIEGTEAEMWEYAQAEFGAVPLYSQASEDEIKALKKAGFKIYTAPRKQRTR